jgi:mannose-6-phosphate isomerase-like protein (cupin superfamily)
MSRLDEQSAKGQQLGSLSDSSYRPSPRPTYDGPTLITPDTCAHHIWGDAESGEVADSIYVSSDRVHALVFELPSHGAFRHSKEYRTVFGADEVLYVIEGVMAIANPETGEVQRIDRGECVFFRRDTWHHAFAQGEGPLRVLELFAPPPSTGTSGAYARQRPYLERSRYAEDNVLGHLGNGSTPRRTFLPLSDRSLVWRRDLGVLVGLYASTEHLTVGILEVDPGQAAQPHSHGGDEILYMLEGRLTVRAWGEDSTAVLEAGPDAACYLPMGCRHEYRNFGSKTARAIFAVAPHYLPEGA